VTKYFSCLVQRRNFGDLLSPDGVRRLEIRSHGSIDALFGLKPKPSALVAIWTRPPLEFLGLPEIFVCEEDAEVDWAAWITTYGARIRPFSAHSRLMSVEKFRHAIQNERSPQLGKLVWPAAGIVLGEVLSASGMPDTALDTLPASSYQSTLSFAIFRAAAISSEFGDWSAIIGAWEFVREATRQRQRPLDSTTTARICAIALLSDEESITLSNDFGGADPELIAACRQIIRDPSMTLYSLTRVPGFADAVDKMRGTREDRVVAFESFAREILSSSSVDEATTSFALGYLVSRIAPGTIQHAALLSRFAQKLPGAYLWYGFCAALESSSERLPIMTSTEQTGELPGSARRVVRDILRVEHILGTPTCDVGFSELAALYRTGGDPLAGITTSTQTTVVTELLPAVSTILNVASKPLSDKTHSGVRDKEIFNQLGHQIEHLQETYWKLREGEDRSRDTSRFSTSYSPRRTKR
jgi:hypothetical protein